ncbi:hypothetical protein A3H21_00650 [Candidatus Woesebacteria bacterium RIFCSPLOWO2_12_FULL_42_8]|nr:MAG: hypothetical protein A3H21_00650 [Candidatus Woesebacteria bacterium RIFCSPLOWO2_12_FULL_42_8]
MRFIGIDYGASKIGLASSETKIAEPLTVLRGNRLFERTVDLIKKYSPEMVVVGISENESGKQYRQFARRLSKTTGIKTVLEDETLSTYEAQNLARLQNIGRRRRSKLEDAFAATIVLQSYLDKNV